MCGTTSLAEEDGTGSGVSPNRHFCQVGGLVAGVCQARWVNIIQVGDVAKESTITNILSITLNR